MIITSRRLDVEENVSKKNVDAETLITVAIITIIVEEALAVMEVFHMVEEPIDTFN